MASNPTGTFQCPNCGSPLTAHGADKEIQCSYCGSTVIVPEELREAPPTPTLPPPNDGDRLMWDSASPRHLGEVPARAEGVGCATRIGLVIGLAAAAIGIAIAIAVFFIPSRVQSTFQQSSIAQNNVQGTTDAAMSLAQNAVQTANALVKTSVPVTPTVAPTQPIPTPAPFARTLFQDDFASAASGWPRAKNPKYTLEYKSVPFQNL